MKSLVWPLAPHKLGMVAHACNLTGNGSSPAIQKAQNQTRMQETRKKRKKVKFLSDFHLASYLLLTIPSSRGKARDILIYAAQGRSQKAEVLFPKASHKLKTVTLIFPCHSILEIKKFSGQMATVAHDCNLNIWTSEIGKSEVQCQPQLYSTFETSLIFRRPHFKNKSK